jgi:glycosyltransferase involved in cell wall biosynthesis
VSNSETGDQYWSALAPRRVRRYVIANGLPLSEIAQAPPATPEGSHLRAGEPLILNAGRFEPQKDFETFIRALRLVASDRPVQAVCCGNGSLRGRIEQAIVDRGLVAEVRLSGYASNLWSLMKRANIVVSTSLFEGNPNVVLEAMAAGCPLVVSDIPTHREILDEESAIFARPGDPRQFADGILNIIRDSDAAAKRACAARSRIQRYSTSVMAQKYIEVYRAILPPQRSVQHVPL